MPVLFRRRRDGLRFPSHVHAAGARNIPRRPGRRPLHSRFAGWLSRNRRLVAALLLCAAAAIAVQQLTPAPLTTVTALSAARDLPAGTTVTAADLAQVQVPPGMVTDGFLRDGSATAGKQLAAPLRKGQLLTDAQLLGPGLLAGTPPVRPRFPCGWRMPHPSSWSPRPAGQHCADISQRVRPEESL
ncbi:SAF domain-containing protein [Arthrobacter sp. FX8]|uniref:SAF domain-containing protein n=1 Tax=Arthrobacter sp. FX8 TaxID=2997335 RepID=UPI00227CE85E|nr:SAF domain-containing protein [Arthrobacter sp. FX8]WAJ31681.1 SAF domain-containing protein [Arthrobacter sp. FX8]